VGYGSGGTSGSENHNFLVRQRSAYSLQNIQRSLTISVVAPKSTISVDYGVDGADLASGPLDPI
jgi:hypothetical protein